eukprot:CAMPEP_0198557486 /NCGR_PEP_ID=MMETSP1462-20131121/88715_1 /TAXON_ID=1333877 /ORGANISM="Brandtodinium nutriculum, Strain RCC3387" /LENGTH=67 /DNA_ID=CAMNT_0044288271 /DNA_START=403 /DNA_END=606 /DNA_ORIENTATION=-
MPAAQIIQAKKSVEGIRFKNKKPALAATAACMFEFAKAASVSGAGKWSANTALFVDANAARTAPRRT